MTGSAADRGTVDGSGAEAAHVEFEEVAKSYDGRTMAVQGFDLRVRRGEFVTLLGPSGSGKTTILTMLAGFEAPTSGVIRIDGSRVDDLPPRRRGIGMVFQNYALFPHMSVEENLAFPLEVRGLARDECRERVDSALRLVRLEGLEKRRPGQLSGGQQQRVAIARALVFEPSLVLMDEPLGALDRRLREEMQYEIRRIHRELAVTVVYVTHDQEEAMVLSERIGVLRAGAVEQIAGPEALYEEPERSFVADFIGENNHLDGTVIAVDGDFCGSGGRQGAGPSAQNRRVQAGRPRDSLDSTRARRRESRSGPLPEPSRGHDSRRGLCGRPPPRPHGGLRRQQPSSEDSQRRRARRGLGRRHCPHRVDGHGLPRPELRNSARLNSTMEQT